MNSKPNKGNMRVNVVVDDIKSWFVPYGKKIVKQLKGKHQVKLIHDSRKIKKGDCTFFLSCLKIVPKKVLNLSRNNLVIHGSNLPEGKGFSPVSWQILEGKSEITLTLFEASEKIDSGNIYFKKRVRFQGHELLDEIHQKIGDKIVKMAIKFIVNYPKNKSRKQKGSSSYYRRRTIKDDELPINKPLKELFNRFRVADNKRHPVYFHYKGGRYTLKINKENE